MIPWNGACGIPERYGPPTTCYNRFVRWRKAGVWDRLLEEVSKAFDGGIVMIDSTCVRIHQHGATGKKGLLTMVAWDVPVFAALDALQPMPFSSSSKISLVIVMLTSFR